MTVTVKATIQKIEQDTSCTTPCVRMVVVVPKTIEGQDNLLFEDLHCGTCTIVQRDLSDEVRGL